MRLKIICVAYERPVPLRIMIDSFLVQTCGDWDMYIIHDGQPSNDVLRVIDMYNDTRLHFEYTKERIHTDEKPDWGHTNRRNMLQNMHGEKNDFVLITNDDNYYVPVFIEYFKACMNLPGVAMVYCNTVHSHIKYNVLNTQVKEKQIDMGSFIVRLDVAKETGFNSTCHSADGIYAEQCLATCTRRGLLAYYINKPLFIHN